MIPRSCVAPPTQSVDCRGTRQSRTQRPAGSSHSCPTSRSAIRSSDPSSTTRPPRPIVAACTPRSQRRSILISTPTDVRGTSAPQPPVLTSVSHPCWRPPRNGRGSGAVRPPLHSFCGARPSSRLTGSAPPRRLLEAARAELVGGRGPRAREILDRAREIGLARPASGRGGVDRGADPHRRRRRAAGRVSAARGASPDRGRSAGARCRRVSRGCRSRAQRWPSDPAADAPRDRRRVRGTSPYVAISRSPSPRWWQVLLPCWAESAAAADETLRQAVTNATRDQAHLQAVAGRRVHVVYFDTILAAADVLDDRAWGDLADEWTLLARRIGALSSLPLALSLRSWLEVLQGRLGSAASHLAEIEDVVSLTGARGLLGSPAARARPARRVAGGRRGHAEGRSPHDAGRARTRTGARHRPCLRRARRTGAWRRSVRRCVPRGTTPPGTRQRRAWHAHVARRHRGRHPVRRVGRRRRGAGPPVANARLRRRHPGRAGCWRALRHSSHRRRG